MNQRQNTDQLQPVYPQYVNAYVNDDEINLVDLWISLLRYKKVYMWSFIAMLAIGILAVSVLVSNKYSLSSVIGIGHVSVGNGDRYIETPAAVTQRINTVLLPRLTQKVADENNINLFKTSVSNPKDTNLVVIENNVIESHQNTIEQFQRALIERIKAEHDKMSEVMNRELREKLARAKLTLKEIENPLELIRLTKELVPKLQAENMTLFRLSDKAYLEQRKKNYEESLELMEKEANVLTEQNEALHVQASIQKLEGSASYETALIETEILSNKRKLNEIRRAKLELQQEFLIYELELEPKAEQHKGIVKSVEDELELVELNWQSQIAAQQQVIAELESQLEGRSTQALGVAQLSLNPVGLSKNTGYALVVVLSMLGALFITLLAMFRNTVNQKLLAEAKK